MLILDVAHKVVVAGELSAAPIKGAQPRRTTKMSHVVPIQVAYLVEAPLANPTDVWARVPFHMLPEMRQPVCSLGTRRGRWSRRRTSSPQAYKSFWGSEHTGPRGIPMVSSRTLRGGGQLGV